MADSEGGDSHKKLSGVSEGLSTSVAVFFNKQSNVMAVRASALAQVRATAASQQLTPSGGRKDRPRHDLVLNDRLEPWRPFPPVWCDVVCRV